MNKLKILSGFVATIIVTTSVMAGGDPRDFGPVESFDSLESITILSEEMVEQEVISKTSSGIIITEETHNTCKSNLNLSKSNVARFKEALSGGHLYNVGPLDALGTLFSPNRWDNYLDCVEMYGVS